MKFLELNEIDLPKRNKNSRNAFKADRQYIQLNVSFDSYFLRVT